MPCVLLKRAGMERARCSSTTPGSVVHLAQGVLGPSTDLSVQMLSEEDR